MSYRFCSNHKWDKKLIFKIYGLLWYNIYVYNNLSLSDWWTLNTVYFSKMLTVRLILTVVGCKKAQQTAKTTCNEIKWISDKTSMMFSARGIGSLAGLHGLILLIDRWPPNFIVTQLISQDLPRGVTTISTLVNIVSV